MSKWDWKADLRNVRDTLVAWAVFALLAFVFNIFFFG